jgi:hypothetical protein
MLLHMGVILPLEPRYLYESHRSTDRYKRRHAIYGEDVHPDADIDSSEYVHPHRFRYLIRLLSLRFASHCCYAWTIDGSGSLQVLHCDGTFYEASGADHP